MTRLLHIRAHGPAHLDVRVGPSRPARTMPGLRGDRIHPNLPETAFTPHWFQCVGSVTADPAPFNFELTALPATHTGVVVDWGDGNRRRHRQLERVRRPFPHISRRTNGARTPSRSPPRPVRVAHRASWSTSRKTRAPCWFTATTTPAAPPFRDSRKSTSTWPSAPPGISLSTGEMAPLRTPSPWQDVLNDPAYDTLRFSSIRRRNHPHPRNVAHLHAQTSVRRETATTR